MKKLIVALALAGLMVPTVVMAQGKSESTQKTEKKQKKSKTSKKTKKGKKEQTKKS
jgi:hypothetical protein